MGLDMFLNGERQVNSFYDENTNSNAKAIKALYPELNVFDDDCIESIQIEIGYWRKANAIHKWFVDNVQNGQDNCIKHYVYNDDLLELKNLCNQVLDDTSLAYKLLPTEEGFFFGCTDYNDWYFQSLNHTIVVIDRALSLPNTWSITYTSSW